VASAFAIRIRHRLSTIQLDVHLEGERRLLALVGPSGAGKSSLLRVVAGLLRPDAGVVEVNGRTLLDTARKVDLPANERRIGLVFQDGALFPHLSVLDNVRYGLRARGISRAAGVERARDALERLHVGHLADERPPRLSGGERQRVALARAVVTDPELLLLDEPLSALDAVTKGEVAADLARRVDELGLPTLFVSHDFEDVLGLAAAVAVMERGRIVQQGTISELVEAPASPFVAAFAGVNFFEGTARHRDGITEVQSVEPATFLSTDVAEGPVGVVIHPWDVVLTTTRPSGSAQNVLEGKIERVVPVGNRARVVVASAPVVVAEVTQDSVERMGLAPGVNVIATWKATGTRLVPVGA